MDEEEQEEEDPDLDAKESRVSREKGGASPDGASNWSDSSVTENEEGTRGNDGSGTTGTEYVGAGICIDPDVSSGIETADKTEIEGSEIHYSNICGADNNVGVSKGQDPLH